MAEAIWGTFSVSVIQGWAEMSEGGGRCRDWGKLFALVPLIPSPPTLHLLAANERG